MEDPAIYAQPLKAEEFAMLGEELHPLELSRGRVVREPPPLSQHGAVCAMIGAELHHFARRTHAGRVFTNDTWFVLERNPDTVRCPDIAFIRAERAGDLATTPTLIEGPPDLAVEVLSPGDQKGRIEKKLSEYLEAGTPVIWLVQPRDRSVTVFENGAKRHLASDQSLTCPSILPCFALAVVEIFV